MGRVGRLNLHLKEAKRKKEILEDSIESETMSVNHQNDQ